MKLTKAVSFTRFSTLRGRLTPGQLAFAKIAYDGLEPCDLKGEERERAGEIWTPDVERIPFACRSVVVQVKGRDVGGTRNAAERLSHLGETVELDGLERDEIAYCVFVGPKLRHARIGLRFALAACHRNGLRVDDESSDGFTLVRHDGRRVRFEAFAASRGGDTVRGVPIIGALLDEAGFFFDEQNVACGEAVFGAIVPRLIKGGQILIISSPWTESGLLHSEFTKNHGHPLTAMAAFCPTLTMRDDPETARTVARERQRDPENARREFDAEFMPYGSGYYFDRSALDACAVEGMPFINAASGVGWAVFCGYDPAYVSDAAEGVIVRSDGALFEVVEVFTRVPAKNQPLVPSVVDGEFAALVRRHGGNATASDIHYEQSVKENVGKHGVRFVAAPGSNAGKAAVFGVARELIHAGRVKWSAGHLRLTRQMREVVSKPLPGGLIAISSPRRKGNHGDGASALCLALWLAKHSVGEVAAAQARQARRAAVDQQMAQRFGDNDPRGPRPREIGHWTIDSDGAPKAVSFTRGAGWVRPETRTVIGYRRKYIGRGVSVDEPIFEDDENP